MDDIVRDSVDCLARRLHDVPCCRRVDSPPACARGDFYGSAFRNGQTSRLGLRPFPFWEEVDTRRLK